MLITITLQESRLRGTLSMGGGRSKEDGDRLFSVVLSDMTRGNRHKLKHRKCHVNVRKMFSVRVVKLVVQRGLQGFCPWSYGETNWTWSWGRRKKRILICKKLHCNSEHCLQKCDRINTGERRGAKVRNLGEELPRGM